MNPDVATVNEQTPLAEVIDALILAPLKRVIVVDSERRMQGIISDVDVLARMREDMRPGLLTFLTGWTRGNRKRLATGALRTHHGKAQVAADVMDREVTTVTETTSVQEAIDRMMAMRRRALPVVNERGQLVGMVGRSDLLRVLVEG